MRCQRNGCQGTIQGVETSTGNISYICEHCKQPEALGRSLPPPLVPMFSMPPMPLQGMAAEFTPSQATARGFFCQYCPYAGLYGLLEETKTGQIIERCPFCKRNNSKRASRPKSFRPAQQKFAADFARPLLATTSVRESLIIPDGTNRTMRICATRADGNCGFRAILGQALLQDPTFSREHAIAPLIAILDDPQIKELLSQDLLAMYQSGVAEEGNFNGLPESIKLQFQGFYLFEGWVAGRQWADDLDRAIHQYCLRVDVLTIYLTEYLSNPQCFPHVQGSLTAFAYFFRKRLHCLQVMEADERHPTEWLYIMDDIQHPDDVAGYYLEDVYILQNISRDHFSRLELVN